MIELRGRGVLGPPLSRDDDAGVVVPFGLRLPLSKHDFAFSRRDLPEVCMTLSLLDEREQGMPGARCTRGLVCKIAQRNAHTSIQVQRRQSGIPCAMVLRLMPRSPRRRIRLVTVVRGLRLA